MQRPFNPPINIFPGENNIFFLRRPESYVNMKPVLCCVIVKEVDSATDVYEKSKRNVHACETLGIDPLKKYVKIKT